MTVANCCVARSDTGRDRAFEAWWWNTCEWEVMHSFFFFFLFFLFRFSCS